MPTQRCSPVRRLKVWHGLARSSTTLALVGALAACSTTGRAFDSSRLGEIVPGQTTLEQTIDILKADPENIYRGRDGSAMARWAHKTSVVVDAVYYRQELWLQFDHHGRFDRVLNKVNIVGDAAPPQVGTAGQVPPQSVYSVYQPAASAVVVQQDSLSTQLPAAVPQGFPYSTELFYGPIQIYPIR